MKTETIGRRFYALTTFGFLGAILACSIVVWTLSVPFLKSAKSDYLLGAAKQQASAAGFVLDELFDRAEAWAAQPAFRDLVRGETDSTSAISDRIAAFEEGGLQNAVLLDFEGRPLYQMTSAPQASRIFHDVEHRAAFRNIEDIAPGASRPGQILLRFAPGNPNPVVLVGIPIVVDSAVEGALFVEQVLELEQMLLGGTRLATPFQLSLAQQHEEAIFAPIPGMPLFVLIGEEQAANRTLSTPVSSLVFQITIGLSAVLLFPFLAMSLFGRQHLIAPTEALAESRELLASQKEVLKRQSEELRELATVAELSRDAITITDRNGKIQWVNNAFTELTGYTPEEAIGKNPGKLLQNETTDPNTKERIRAAVSAGLPVREEIRNVDKAGRPYWVALSISPIIGGDGEVQRFAAITSDISERRAIQEALAQAQIEAEYKASHDTLTGLPNRRYLDKILTTEVGRDLHPRTLIRVDLDFFKNVNDTHGHAAGDHVLRVVGQILGDNSRSGDFISRVGGDEFVVLLRKSATEEEAKTLCDRFRSEIRKDIVFEGKTCRVGASFGVASAQDGLLSNENLLVGADAALYVSKEAGRNTTTVYTPQIHSIVLAKRRSSVEIEKALERKEFEAFFQPQFDAKTRKLAGLEALVRWHHPDQGVLAPRDFLPLAEQLCLVPEIDALVYEKGLEAVVRLNRDGFRIPKISFNVGVKQLESPLLPTIYERYDLGETRVSFEVLESVLVEDQSSEFQHHIDLLRERGFGVEVDDFGSGHASVVGLMQLLPEAMKLDQQLILPLDCDPKAVTTVRALIEIGRSHGIKVTAEGVETETHAQILTELGVDTLQGYCFAPALSFSQLQTFLQGLAEKSA